MNALIVDLALVATMGVLAVLLGGPVVQGVFRRVDRSMRAAGPKAVEARTDAADAVGTLPATRTTASQPGVVAAAAQLRGGVWIGRLERLAIFAGLVCHYPEAIAISLALKGVARYPELKATTAGAAERFIIGTFVSVLWACGCAGLALWLVGRF